MRLIILEGMVHFARHERVRVLLEDAQAGAGAEVDPLLTIGGAGIVRRVLEFPPTDGFVFRSWNNVSLSQSSVFLVM